MWRLCMMWNVIIIPDLVFGEVHKVPTGVAGKQTKEWWEIITTHVL